MAIPYMLCGLGLTVAHIAAVRGVRVEEIVLAMVTAASFSRCSSRKPRRSIRYSWSPESTRISLGCEWDSRRMVWRTASAVPWYQPPWLCRLCCAARMFTKPLLKVSKPLIVLCLELRMSSLSRRNAIVAAQVIH